VSCADVLYHVVCELEKRGDGKNDNNKSVREAGNNNRESAPGTRPKGKNVRPSFGEEIVFFSFWLLLRIIVLYCRLARWT